MSGSEWNNSVSRETQVQKIPILASFLKKLFFYKIYNLYKKKGRNKGLVEKQESHNLTWLAGWLAGDADKPTQQPAATSIITPLTTSNTRCHSQTQVSNGGSEIGHSLFSSLPLPFGLRSIPLLHRFSFRLRSSEQGNPSTRLRFLSNYSRRFPGFQGIITFLTPLSLALSSTLRTFSA